MANELTASVVEREPRTTGRAGPGSWRPRISVAVVNNMPDMALQTTERQFLTHLEAGAQDFDLRVHLFSLPGIARSGAARDRVKAKYLDYSCLRELHMDALIVTGAVPVATSLADELATEVLPLLETGRIKPIVHATFPLAKAADAHHAIDEAHIGKIVLTVG